MTTFAYVIIKIRFVPSRDQEFWRSQGCIYEYMNIQLIIITINVLLLVANTTINAATAAAAAADEDDGQQLSCYCCTGHWLRIAKLSIGTKLRRERTSHIQTWVEFYLSKRVSITTSYCHTRTVVADQHHSSGPVKQYQSLAFETLSFVNSDLLICLYVFIRNECNIERRKKKANKLSLQWSCEYNRLSINVT